MRCLASSSSLLKCFPFLDLPRRGVPRIEGIGSRSAEFGFAGSSSAPGVKVLAWVMVVVLGLYGLINSLTSSYGQMRTSKLYDPMSGIYQEIVSPTVLEYTRLEVTRRNF
jgi:hypothetical protein